MDLYGDKNQCQSCKEYFNSGFAFDKHRTGEFGVDRRCRSPLEMSSVGMVKNARMYWISKPMDVGALYGKATSVLDVQKQKAS
jgi:hypothetical protein